MHIDSAFLSAISVLIGALMGGSASLAAAIYTQRHQDRLQRVARETTKREQVYADFIVSASKLLLNAYVHDEITLDGDEQHIVGLANRMRLFAPPNVIDEAEAVIRGLIEISLKPSMDLRKLAMAELSKNPDSDLLLPFSLACRADLDKLYRTVH
jgi:sugar/nucleoside kinase (ribokinase family)